MQGKNRNPNNLAHKLTPTIEPPLAAILALPALLPQHPLDTKMPSHSTMPRHKCQQSLVIFVFALALFLDLFEEEGGEFGD
jgi:hypothetical protein